MRRIAQQRHPAVAPARQRVAVAHRVFPELRRRRDDLGDVGLRQREAAGMRQHLVQPAGPRPVLAPRRGRAAVADAGADRPVGQPPVRRGARRDRVQHDLRLHAAGDDHGPPVHIGRPVDRAAPDHDAVPGRRSLVRGERVAHDRMDAVGGDQNVAPRSAGRRAVAVDEMRDHLGFALLEAGQAAAVVDLAAQPLARRLVQHAVQPAAVDRELRHREAGIQAARLAPHDLAEAVGVEQLPGADGDGVQPVEQAEPGKLLDRMRQGVDADADLPRLGRLLEHGAADAARLQHQRRGQPADAATDDDRLHRSPPSMSWRPSLQP